MWLQSLVAEFEAFEFKGVSATSSIAARFEMAAAVESVITEEAYTIHIKTIAVEAEAMDTLCFSSRTGSRRTLVTGEDEEGDELFNVGGDWWNRRE